MATPSFIVLGAHFNRLVTQSLDLDYVRDGGSKVATATGATPAIVTGGKFSHALQISGVAEYVNWSDTGLVDALVTTGCVSFWIKTGYSGTPAQIQRIFQIDNGSSANMVRVLHYSGSGNLGFDISNQFSASIVSIFAAWAPTAGQWYHVELNWDVTAGATRAFIDGVQFGATDVSTGTRTGAADTLEIGTSNGVTSTANDFAIDELLICDEVLHTAPFAVPTAELYLTADVDQISIGVYDVSLSGSGEALLNPSFETPLVAGGVSYVSVPASWQQTTAAGGHKAATFGPPYEWVESYEAGWSGNDGALDAFADADLSAFIFGTASPDEDDHLLTEGYEQDWNSNEDNLSAFGPTDLSPWAFNDGADETEDYEAQWPKRHKANDARHIIDGTIVADGSPPQVYAVLNDVKAQYEAHRTDTAVHAVGDAVNNVTAVDCGDPVSAAILANDLWVTCWSHMVDAGDVFHTPDIAAPMVKPTPPEYPAVTLNDAARLCDWLRIYVNAHFEWNDNAGPLLLTTYQDILAPADDSYSYLDRVVLTHGGEYEGYESDWRGNENALSQLGPGDQNFFLFLEVGGTTDTETYDDAQENIALPAVGNDSAAATLDPTSQAQLVFTGTATGLEVDVETTRGQSSTFVARETLTTPSVTVALSEDTTEVRLHTVALTGGTATAAVHWKRSETL